MTQERSFLYLEDDPLGREVIRIALQDVMKYKKVWIFEDSENFMDRAKALECIPDVIMLDIHMRPLNGFQVLELLRKDGSFSNSRIIALTASVMNEEVEMLKTSGFDSGIAKPIDPFIFPGLIERIINGETIWHIS
jgi:CheY-like chemotaxis protein